MYLHNYLKHYCAPTQLKDDKLSTIRIRWILWTYAARQAPECILHKEALLKWLLHYITSDDSTNI